MCGGLPFPTEDDSSAGKPGSRGRPNSLTDAETHAIPTSNATATMICRGRRQLSEFPEVPNRGSSGVASVAPGIGELSDAGTASTRLLIRRPKQ